MSSGASSSPVPYGGQCRLKIVLGRCGHLRDHSFYSGGEFGLVLLPVRLPWSPVCPPGRDHLVAVDVDDAALGELDVLRLRDHIVDVELVVVARARKGSNPRSFELLVGQCHPPLDGREHLVVEEAGRRPRGRLVTPQLVRVRAERVVAVA